MSYPERPAARTALVQGQTFAVRDSDIPADGDCGVVLEDGTFVTVACADRISATLRGATEDPVDAAMAETERIRARRRAARNALVGRR